MALLAALVSSFTERPVRADLAMTAEITLPAMSSRSPASRRRWRVRAGAG